MGLTMSQRKAVKKTVATLSIPRCGPRFLPPKKSQMVISMELRQRRAHAMIADLPATEWQRINCGDGARGPRLYD